MDAAIYETDFYSDAFIKDPHAHYKEMRDAGPVAWLSQNNCYAVTRYAEVVEVLRRADRFQSGRGLSLNDDVNRLLVGNTLNADSPEHERRRSVTSIPIMPKNIAPLDDYIRETAETLAEALVRQQRFDAVAEFAQILPLAIVVDLVGLPDEGKAKMLTWASAAFNLFEGFNARSQAAFDDLKGLQQFLEIHGTRAALKEGGLAQRIFDVAPDKGFSEEEAAQLMRDYINPSLDTTISVAGFAPYYFAKHPDQWELLRADPTLVANAVEELVRLVTPIRAFSRYVACDTDVSGVALPKGARIIACYASANRDERMWEDPDRIDVTRVTRKHLGFGHGKHTCMGLHLARRELIHLITAMLKHVRPWKLDGEPQIAMNNTIRAFSHLPVRIET